VIVTEVDPTLNNLTEQLVWATIGLAGATFILAVAGVASAIIQGRQLKVLKAEIEVTREQLRPHLELRNPDATSGQLPRATVEYVSGSEAASDPYVWFRTQGGRFAKVPNTPSPASRSHPVTVDELPAHLEPTWSRYFTEAEKDLALAGHGQWWAAVTWRAADGRRYCWMYVQRTHHVEPVEFVLPAGD
jgi:hypothetical protein